MKTLIELADAYAVATYKSGDPDSEKASHERTKLLEAINNYRTSILQELTAVGMPEPKGYLIPKLNTFVNVEKVHFSRAEGCEDSDAELIEKLQGTVLWAFSPFHNDERVTDKHGVIHTPKPLVALDKYREFAASSVAKKEIDFRTNCMESMPDCWVVIKDGRIAGTHDEPCSLNGIEAIRYIPAAAVSEQQAKLTVNAPNGDKLVCHGSALDMATLESVLKKAAAVSGPASEVWIVVKEHVWEHGDGSFPTLAYLLPSEFGRTTYPSFEAASAFIRESSRPLGWVAMKLDATPVPQWTDIESAMPEPMVPVLVYNGKQVFIERWGGKDYLFERTITHWMSLPPPPSGTGEKHE